MTSRRFKSQDSCKLLEVLLNGKIQELETLVSGEVDCCEQILNKKIQSKLLQSCCFPSENVWSICPQVICTMSWLDKGTSRDLFQPPSFCDRFQLRRFCTLQFRKQCHDHTRRYFHISVLGSFQSLWVLSAPLKTIAKCRRRQVLVPSKSSERTLERS